MKLRKVGILFFAKLQGIVLAMIGLAAGIVYSFGGAVYDVLTTGSMNLGTVLAFLALLGMPVLFGSLGFITGAIEAAIYNLTARLFGGIEADFET